MDLRSCRRSGSVPAGAQPPYTSIALFGSHSDRGFELGSDLVYSASIAMERTRGRTFAVAVPGRSFRRASAAGRRGGEGETSSSGHSLPPEPALQPARRQRSRRGRAVVLRRPAEFDHTVRRERATRLVAPPGHVDPGAVVATLKSDQDHGCPATFTGTVLPTVEPVPSCPASFRPQQYSTPPLDRAQFELNPTLNSVNVSPPATCSAVG